MDGYKTRQNNKDGTMINNASSFLLGDIKLDYSHDNTHHSRGCVFEAKQENQGKNSENVRKRPPRGVCVLLSFRVSSVTVFSFVFDCLVHVFCDCQSYFRTRICSVGWASSVVGRKGPCQEDLTIESTDS